MLPVSAVRDLRIYIDADLIMSTHVSLQPLGPASATVHFRWLRLARGIFSAGMRQGYPAAPCVSPETEAEPVQRLFCQLNLAFDGLLVMFRL